MKKVFLSTLMVLMAAMMYAVPTPTVWGNVVTVKLTDGNSDTYQSRFGTSPELTDEASWSAAPTNLEGATVRAYINHSGVDYEQLFLKTMENVPLIIKTYNSASLTIKLTANEGTISLYDIQEDKVTTVTKGGTEATKDYVCTVPTGATITDRFVLFYEAPTKGICFNYNKLELTKYKGAKVDVYAKGGTTPVDSKTIASDAKQTMDLSSQASGRYIVKIDLDGDSNIDEEYQIDVKPSVTVVP